MSYANAPIIVWDNDRKITLFNGFVAFTGYSKESILGKNLDVLFPASQSAEILQTIREASGGEKWQSVEVPIMCKHGETRIALWNSANIKDKNGNIVATLAQGHDITERKKAEEALKRSEVRFRDLAESISDVFFAMDNDLRYTYWNRASEELTGISAKEAIGKSLTEVFPDVKDTEVEQFYRNVLRTKQHQTFVNKYRVKEKDFIFEIDAYPTKDGISVFTKDITESKRDEENLRQSEEKYRRLFELAPDSIISFDQKGVVTSCNTAATIMSGYSKDELVGKHFSKMAAVRARDIPKYLKIFTSIVRGKTPKPFEIVWKNKNGTSHFGEVHCSFMKEKGKLVGTQVIMRDITERKQADEAIRQSEKRYRSLYEAISSGIVVQDHEGRIIEANDMACEILGLTRDQMQGRTSTDPRWRAIHEDGSPFLGNEHPAMITLRTGKRIRNTIMGVFHPNDGEYKWIQINSEPVIDHYNPSAKGVMTTFLDITENKETEKALRASKETYKALINGMNDTAWVIDLDAKFVDVNDAAVKVLGYSREELLSMGPSDIDSSLSSEEISKLVKNMPADQVQVFETSHITKDGKKIPVEISSSLVNYQGKQAVLSIARNITERKKMVNALRESEEKYRQQFTEALDAIFVADAETGILVDCNPAACELVGRE
ncbi:PAS domain S-box protein, partial [Candidatus Bathyarchaeota archaeon]|nr:PAS domain S-box protein [Candidatus Bathyarchaeota archaeon]